MTHATKLLQTAVTFHQTGKLEDAEKAYRKLLRVDAANGDGLRLLGGLYLQRGQMPQAVESLEKAARLLPKHAETLANLALALSKHGRPLDAMARYRQALELQPDYVIALNNLGGLLHEAGRIPEALVLYGQVLRLSPDHAPAHFNYGNVLLAQGKMAEAVARYEHALKLKPDYLEAMINLGMVLSHSGKGEQGRQWLGIARSWFDKALQADPTNVSAMNNIGNVLRQQNKAAESIPYFREALRLRPDYVEAAINLATSQRDLNLLDDAIESCRQALRFRPDDANARINLGVFLQDKMQHEEAITLFTEALQTKPLSIDAKWNKSLSLLALGRYREGWELHEIGLGVAHMRGENPSSERRWQGEDISGKRLLIWCEQGFGDSLQFIRYAELCKARGAVVLVFCPRPLRKLLANSAYIDELLESIEDKDFDLHTPMMSLPYNFGTELETIPAQIPYLKVSETARAKWADKILDTSGFKVGLVWAGNPRENQINAHMADRRRSMDLEMLLPLFEVPGVHFYNLQMGAKVSQIDSCGLRDRMIDLMGDVKDFEDTAALVEQLDLVISVDTSVVHLAGALGKPVWVLSRFDACWRWLQNRPDSPWYPSVRLFGQKTHGDWAEVVDRVRKALTEAAS